MLSAAIARNLQIRGARPGDGIVVDLPNCPAYVFLMMAAAYGGYTLICPSTNRLTEAEKVSRVMEVERKPGMAVAARIDESSVKRLMDRATALLTGEEPGACARRIARGGGRRSPPA